MFCISSILDTDADKYIKYCTMYDNIGQYRIEILDTDSENKLIVTCRDIYDYSYKTCEKIFEFTKGEQIFGVSFQLGLITLFDNNIRLIYSYIDFIEVTIASTLANYISVSTCTQDFIYNEFGSIYIDILNCIEDETLKLVDDNIILGYHVRNNKEYNLAIVHINNVKKFKGFVNKYRLLSI